MPKKRSTTAKMRKGGCFYEEDRPMDKSRLAGLKPFQDHWPFDDTKKIKREIDAV